MKVRRTILFASIAGVLAGAVFLVRAQTRPAVNISPEAKTLLDEVGKAYSTAKTLELAGDVSLQFDGAGQSSSKRSEFTSTYAAPNQFRHDLKDDLVIVSTGEKLTVYSTVLNQFVAADVAKNERLGDDAPPLVLTLLGKQNPSLLAALAKDPGQSITDGATDVSVAPDVALDGRSFSALALSKPGVRMTVLIDKNSHLMRKISVDLRERLAKEIPDLKTATITIDYSRADAGIAIKADQFAYELPKDAKPAAIDIADDGEYNARARALVGKPAPELKLKDLSGADVDLSSLKGNVVVLDFWATWCPACKELLPGYVRLAADYASRGEAKFFTVNLAEPPLKVRQYLEREGLNVPTLLDERGEIGDRYGAEAIPVTFIIDRTGVVAKVISGATEDQIVQAITQASH